MYNKIKTLFKPIWSIPFIYRIWQSSLLYQTRGALFNAKERLLGFPRERRIFKTSVGYDLHLDPPRSLNEKIIWKKLYDRNPLIPITADKYRVREYIESVLGPTEARDILARLLYVTDDPTSIPFESFGEEYVVKSNHAGGHVLIVDKDTKLNREEVVPMLKDWLRLPYSLFEQEWGYWPIPRKIIVEEVLRDEQGGLVQDYKFHVFHGKCRFIHTTPKSNAQRSGKRSLFTPEWKLLPVGWYYSTYAEVEPPRRLKDMIALAERLAAPFDYVRVDLYNPGDRIYFGELTHYHGAGREPFYPETYDFEFGKHWRVEPGYWKKHTPST